MSNVIKIYDNYKRNFKINHKNLAISEKKVVSLHSE